MSFMERNLENVFEQKAKNDIRNGVNTIGRPFGLGTGGRNNQVEGINWQDYNYPPGIRLIHYNREELPTAISDITKFQKAFFELVCVTCILNVVNSFFCVATASGYPGKYFFYAILNCLIIPPIALGIFYHGYRGLATNSKALLNQYKILHGLALIFLLLFTLVPLGSINGYTRYGTDAYKNSTGTGYWAFAIFLESSLYLVNLIISTIALVKVQNFDPYAGGATGQPGGPATQI